MHAIVTGGTGMVGGVDPAAIAARRTGYQSHIAFATLNRFDRPEIVRGSGRRLLEPGKPC